MNAKDDFLLRRLKDTAEECLRWKVMHREALEASVFFSQENQKLQNYKKMAKSLWESTKTSVAEIHRLKTQLNDVQATLKEVLLALQKRRTKILAEIGQGQ